MNPEQNEQPTQVDQPPQPIPINPTLNAPAPQPEPVGQPAAPNPIVEPAPAPLPAPEYSQAVQNAQAVAQPTVSQHNPKSAKKPFVIAAIGVVVLILAISGIVAANLISSSESSKSIDTELTTVDSDELSENNPQSTGTDDTANQGNSQTLMNERDVVRKSNLTKIIVLISEYQANNNGKIPTNAQELEQVIASDQRWVITDPLSGEAYRITTSDPAKGSTGEIQYAPQQTCNGSDLAPSSSRSFALRGYLESGELLCIPS